MFKRLSMLWVLVRGDLRHLWWALRHPQAPRWLKVGTALLAVYLLSPVDLLPDMLPVVGVVDDLVIIPLVLRWMLNRLPPSLRRDAGHHVDRDGKSPPAAPVKPGRN
jgi:uncharacterized membrane protein YkvA (DUF1232 family)